MIPELKSPNFDTEAAGQAVDGFVADLRYVNDALHGEVGESPDGSPGIPKWQSFAASSRADVLRRAADLAEQGHVFSDYDMETLQRVADSAARSERRDARDFGMSTSSTLLSKINAQRSRLDQETAFNTTHQH